MIYGMPEAPLTAEDYQSVLDAGRTLHSRGWRSTFTVNEQVEARQKLVLSVEEGYRLTVDDYTNDLAVREWLEEVQPLLTDRVEQSLKSRLMPLDERFRQATTMTRRRMPGAGDGWWYRVPRRLVGELAEDIERMNLLDGAG
jgi:hypothetical protein